MNKLLFSASLFLMSFTNVYSSDWVNQNGYVICKPIGFYSPNSLNELQNIVSDASSKGYQIRCIGNGYSTNPVTCSSGIMISLKNLNRILSVDVEKMTVHVEAGISLKDLNAQLSDHGLTLSNSTAINAISLGGAIAVGAHGTGHTGSISSFVKSIQLVTADGQVKYLSDESDKEAFLAAKINLGVLGAVYSIELQCEPLFYLEISHGNLTLDDLVRNYLTDYDSNEFIQYDTNMYNFKSVYKKWVRVSADAPGAVPAYKTLPWFDLDLMDGLPFAELTVAIDKVPEFYKILKAYLDERTDVELYNVEMRFVAQEDPLMSNASDGTICTFHIKAVKGWEDMSFYGELEERMKPINAKPHFGKITYLHHERAKELYGENFVKFLNVKNRLDPNGRFTNSFMDRIFNP